MDKYRVIGLMSGTSLDGLDIAYCEFSKSEGTWSYKIIEAETVAYDNSFTQELANATKLDGLQLSFLHKKLGKLMGQQVKLFCDKRKISPDFLSSHGHTVFHQPKKGLTLQIGDGFELMLNSGFPVINDFRSLDVVLGGQGAPLVPIGDQNLFGEYTYCLNLGGIANISFVQKNQRIAFDICPANMVLNTLTNKLGKAYDNGGEIAQSGNKNANLLDKLNGLDFYEEPAPKSLGFEWVNEKVFPILNSSTLSIEDQLNTFCHHIAYQISKIVSKDSDSKMLVTGGGAYNQFLIDLLAQNLQSSCQVVVPDKNTLEFKEALIFAFLGVLRVRNEVNALASVTGATKDSSGGTLYGM